MVSNLQQIHLRDSHVEFTGKKNHVREKIFNLWFHIPRKCVESMHFYSCPSSPTWVEFFENLFPQDERDGGNYDLLYQNSIRKYEDDLEH